MDSFERSFRQAQAAYDRMEPPEYWAADPHETEEDEDDDEDCNDDERRIVQTGVSASASGDRPTP